MSIDPGMKKRVFVDKELDGQYLPVQYEIVPKSTGDLSGDGIHLKAFAYENWDRSLMENAIVIQNGASH